MKLIPALAILFLSAFPALAAPATTVLAGGCFWSMEKAMDQAPGVTKVVSGYAGGAADHPTYQDYHDGAQPHVEAVEVTYDTARVTYAQILDYYFHHIDPTDARGQFCDFGVGYKPVIFTANDAEKATAQSAKQAVAQTLDKDVAVDIRPAGKFWPAEAYHQDYYIKNPDSYERYAKACGRDRKLKAIWDK